ncbi:MAG: tetratricopeptide repeat protein [Planctomycetaceae bacterium]|jgi:tetratricopeptide (TPR) repeat protein|nr:tetratricopeptide repeat protein [Planctomycetaceae bacterium]
MSGWSSASDGVIVSSLRRAVGGVAGWCRERHLDFEAGIRYRTPAGRLYAYTTWVLIVFCQVAVFLYVFDGCKRYSQSRREIVRGEKYLNTGDFATAAVCFDEAIRLYPYSVPNLYFEGRSMLTRFFSGHESRSDQLVRDGLAFLDAAILLEQKRTLPFIIPKMGDNISDAYFWRGRGRLHLGMYTEAIADFSNAIRIEPHRGEAYLYRGEGYFALRKLDQANSDFDQALKLNPELHEILLKQAALQISSNELDRVITESTRVISLCRYHAEKRTLLTDAYSARGDAYVLKRDFNAALDDYYRLLQIDPNQPEIEKKITLIEKLYVNFAGQ